MFRERRMEICFADAGRGVDVCGCVLEIGRYEMNGRPLSHDHHKWLAEVAKYGRKKLISIRRQCVHGVYFRCEEKKHRQQLDDWMTAHPNWQWIKMEREKKTFRSSASSAFACHIWEAHFVFFFFLQMTASLMVLHTWAVGRHFQHTIFLFIIGTVIVREWRPLCPKYQIYSIIQ